MTATEPQLHNASTTAEISLLDKIAEETARIGSRYMPTLTVKQFSEREKLLAELKGMLVEGTDYGTIPGTQKPTLLLPGAQKLCTFFGYVPHYEVRQIEDWQGAEHGEPLFYYDFTCVLLKDRQPVGEGRGSCNSWETKYRYRIGKRTCPSCGVTALIEGKQWKPSDPKQWVCFEKKGGCKAKFSIDDERIVSQSVGRVANEDFADTINTIQKMGQKRAYIAATLSATGASQYFTQDMEDIEPPQNSGKDTGPLSSGPVEPSAFSQQQSTAAGGSPTGQVKSPDPKPKPAEVPAEVAEMWARSGGAAGQKSGQWATILEELRSTLRELLGEDGQKVMDEVTAQYQPHGGVLSKETFFKRTLLELHKRIVEIKKQVITDDDIPKNMGGTFGELQTAQHDFEPKDDYRK